RGLHVAVAVDLVAAPALRRRARRALRHALGPRAQRRDLRLREDARAHEEAVAFPGQALGGRHAVARHRRRILPAPPPLRNARRALRLLAQAPGGIVAVAARVKEADAIAGGIAQVGLAPQPRLVPRPRLELDALGAELPHLRIEVLELEV